MDSLKIVFVSVCSIDGVVKADIGKMVSIVSIKLLIFGKTKKAALGDFFCGLWNFQPLFWRFVQSNQFLFEGVNRCLGATGHIQLG